MMNRPIGKSRSGSSLITVLCLGAVTCVFAAALAAAVQASNAISVKNEYTQQAYFTARSSANVMIDCITKNSGDTGLVDKMVAQTASAFYPITGLNTSVGQGLAKVEYTDASKSTVKITGEGIYKGVVKKVYAYLSGSDTMSYMITAQNFSIGGTGATLHGGTICIPTNTTLSCSLDGVQKIICHDNLTLSPPDTGSTVGDIITGTQLSITKPMTVTGSITAGGDVLFSPATATVDGDITCAHNVNLNNNIVKGTVTSPNISGGGRAPAQSIRAVSTPSISVTFPPAITNLTSYGYSGVYLNTYTVVSGGRITKSGKIDAALLGSNREIDVDTSGGDLWLCENVTGSGLDSWNGIKMKVSGGHRLYLYLDGATNLTLSGGSSITAADSSMNGRIFILGNGPQRVTLGGNAQIDGFIYLPQGYFSTAAAPAAGMAVNGCIAAQNVSVPAAFDLYYFAPNLSGTPFEGVLSESSGLSKSRHSISWADK